MSFSFAFVAKDRDAALAHLDKQHAPYCVKQFVASALSGVKPGGFVRVEASGHLYERPNDYAVSTATIKVEPVEATV